MIIRINLSGHQNQHLQDAGFVFPGTLQVDLADPGLPDRLTNFLAGLIPPGTTQVMVALPGLAPLAALVLAVIHGLTGHFPIVVPLIRGNDGFVPGPHLDLQAIRNDARTARPDTVLI